MTLDSAGFEVQGVSGSKPSGLSRSQEASERWRRRWRRRLQGASRVPLRGGSAEARHFPTPVRCSGGAGGPGSAAPGLTSLPPAAGTAL